MKEISEPLRKIINPLEHPVFVSGNESLLTENRIVDQIWYSFMFSQGHYDLQFKLLNNLFIKNGPQPHINRDNILNLLRQKLFTENGNFRLRVADAGRHIRQDSMSIQKTIPANPDIVPLGVMVDSLLLGKFDIEILNDKSEKLGYDNFTTKSEVEFILRNIISLDFHNLVTKNGREDRDSKNIGTNNLSDRYFSFFVSYLVRDTKINNPDFQEMFEKLRKSLPFFLKLHKNVGSMKEIVGVYNLYHPQTQVIKEELQALV